MEAVEAWKKVVLENYAIFEGRANRAEFWWFALAQFVLGIVLSILARASGLFLLLYLVYILATFVPSVAVTVRRLHDTGRSGWFYFIALVPFVGWIILLVLLAGEGQQGSNEYGPEPPPGVTSVPA